VDNGLDIRRLLVLTLGVDRRPVRWRPGDGCRCRGTTSDVVAAIDIGLCESGQFTANDQAASNCLDSSTLNLIWALSIVAPKDARNPLPRQYNHTACLNRPSSLSVVININCRCRYGSGCEARGLCPHGCCRTRRCVCRSR
jgi:hypothetical protein